MWIESAQPSSRRRSRSVAEICWHRPDETAGGDPVSHTCLPSADSTSASWRGMTWLLLAFGGASPSTTRIVDPRGPSHLRSPRGCVAIGRSSGADGGDLRRRRSPRPGNRAHGGGPARRVSASHGRSVACRGGLVPAHRPVDRGTRPLGAWFDGGDSAPSLVGRGHRRTDRGSARRGARSSHTTSRPRSPALRYRISWCPGCWPRSCWPRWRRPRWPRSTPPAAGWLLELRRSRQQSALDRRSTGSIGGADPASPPSTPCSPSSWSSVSFRCSRAAAQGSGSSPTPPPLRLFAIWWRVIPPRDSTEVELLPVSDGLALRVEFGWRDHLVMDGGGRRREAAQLLAPSRLHRLEAVVASHGDEDHIAGLAAHHPDDHRRQAHRARLVEDAPGSRAAFAHRTKAWGADRPGRSGITDRSRIDGARNPLAPGRRRLFGRERTLHRALGFKSAEVRSSSRPISAPPPNNGSSPRAISNAAVLVVPHHGSRHSATPDFLDATGPRLALDLRPDPKTSTITLIRRSSSVSNNERSSIGCPFTTDGAAPGGRMASGRCIRRTRMMNYE